MGYFAVQSPTGDSGDDRTVRVGKNFEGRHRGLSAVISLNVAGGTEGNHRRP